MTLTATDRLHFFRSFLRSPRNVGSVIPSSAWLARRMVDPIDFAAARTVVELGAGSGVFTERVLEAKSPDARVLVFERDALMRQLLAEKHPDLELFPDAFELREVVAEDGRVDAVICSLPFANFPRAARARLAEDIYAALRPGGRLIAVQYSLQMRKALRSMFEDVSISFVPLNVPPSFVYTCTKRAEDGRRG
jgi:phospholipid N-methyltransferase